MIYIHTRYKISGGGWAAVCGKRGIMLLTRNGGKHFIMIVINTGNAPKKNKNIGLSKHIQHSTA